MGRRGRGNQGRGNSLDSYEGFLSLISLARKVGGDLIRCPERKVTIVVVF
jgi:hypothetical protein